MPAEERILLRHSLSTSDVRRITTKCAVKARDVEDSLTRFSASDRVSPKTPRNIDYSCNICFDTASDAIVTACGHLYCWPCLYHWLVLPSQLSCPICPVCKSGCELGSLTPIYGRGDDRAGNIEQRSVSKTRTTSSTFQRPPKNLLDQWLLPHLHPPTIPILRDGETPARPSARPSKVFRKLQRPSPFVSPSAPVSIFGNTIFGNTHPIVIFSAGITTLCGMQILQNGGFTSGDSLDSGMNTSRMMWLLAFFIIAGVWFH